MNDTDIDINKLITELVITTGKNILGSFENKGKQQYKRALTAFNLCFRKYLKRSYDKYSKTKTILYRDRPVPLSRFYVATDVSVGKRMISTGDIDSLLGDSNRQVFVGTAGSGKSTFLKHLFTKIIEKKA
ncbi:MAG: ATPase/DNA packaging protein [Desulfobacteraceae bacterium]|jgi:hypothetical protein